MLSSAVDALIYPGVRIGARVKIGERCIIHFNTSPSARMVSSFVTPQIGGQRRSRQSQRAVSAPATNQELVRIASLGTVVIGDDVEIGANTSIDRGTIAATRIGNGTKIDNQVQIGHNVTIGENCMICGRAGIAGSAGNPATAWFWGVASASRITLKSAMTPCCYGYERYCRQCAATHDCGRLTRRKPSRKTAGKPFLFRPY